MSATLRRVQDLAARNDLVVSDHGYDELAADAIMVNDVLASLPLARVVEDYPEFPKGPCVLVLQQLENGSPIHVVWGIPMGRSSPAVLVTAYRPDPERWSPDFLRRRNK